MNSVTSKLQVIRTGEQLGTLGGTRTCDSSLAREPWEIDALPSGYGPGASAADIIPAGAPRQGVLPAEYMKASPAELDLRIRAAKHALGVRIELVGAGCAVRAIGRCTPPRARVA